MCAYNHKMPTKGGMAIYLDTIRDTLCEYEKKEGYSDAIKSSYDLIEDAWVQKLSGHAVTGTIFYLKNAFSKDWRDKTETDITTKGESINKASYKQAEEAISSYLHDDSGNTKR